MNQTPICPYSASKEIPYTNYQLEDFWEGNESDLCVFLENSTCSYKENRLKCLNEYISKAKKTICLLWKEFPEQDILQELLQMKESQGIRVYVLTNSKVYEANKDKWQQLSGHFLVRLIAHSIGNLILTDPNHHPCGCAIFENPFNPEQVWIYGLPKESIAQVFHFFSYTFWREASHEVKQNGLIETGIPPYDLPPLLNPSHILYNTESRKTLLEFVEQSQQFQSLYLCSAQFDLGSPYVKWFINQKASEKACFCPIMAGNGISQCVDMMSQHEIPVFSLTHNTDKFALFQGIIGRKSENAFEGIYFLNSLNALQKGLDLALRMDEKTARYCFQLFQSSIGQYWTYHKVKSLGEIEHSVIQWKADASQIIEIPEKYRETKDLGSLEAKNFEAFENKTTEPDFPEIPDPISKAIEYKWEVIPPRRSKNSKEHSLYKEWENFYKEAGNYRGLLLKKVEEIQQKKSGLAGKVESFLKQFFLGKDHKLSVIQKRIKDMKIESVTKIQEAEDIKTQLENALNELEGHRKEFDTEIDKAEKLAKWEEYRSKWNKEKEDAEGRKSEIEGNIKMLKQEIEDAEQEISDFSNRTDNFKKEKELVISQKAEQENILKNKRIKSEIQSADFEEDAEAIDERVCEVDEEVKSVKGECENGKAKQEKQGEAEL